MIFTRKEMHDCIYKDRVRMPTTHPFLSAITFSESWSVRRYLTVLRHLEYHKNVLSLYRRFFVLKRDKRCIHYMIMGGVIYHIVLYLVFFIFGDINH